MMQRPFSGAARRETSESTGPSPAELLETAEAKLEHFQSLLNAQLSLRQGAHATPEIRHGRAAPSREAPMHRTSAGAPAAAGRRSRTSRDTVPAAARLHAAASSSHAAAHAGPQQPSPAMPSSSSLQAHAALDAAEDLYGLIGDGAASGPPSGDLLLQYKVAAATADHLGARVQVLQKQLDAHIGSEQHLRQEYQHRMGLLSSQVSQQEEQLRALRDERHELLERAERAEEELRERRDRDASMEHELSHLHVRRTRRSAGPVRTAGCRALSYLQGRQPVLLPKRP